MQLGEKEVEIPAESPPARWISVSSFTGFWSEIRASQPSQAAAAMLGLAGPIAVGTLTGHAGIGTVASLGGLALSGDGKGETFREQAPSLAYSLIAGALAMFAGSAMAGNALFNFLGIPAIAVVAGLFGGISRPLVRATTQFILYTIIAANLDLKGASPLGLTLLFFLGAAWTAALSLILRPLFRAMRLVPNSQATTRSTPLPRYSAGQLLRRWHRSLAHLSGWQYPLRITSCLIVGEVFEWIWPRHHGYWVLITVVIVVQRNLQSALPRALHRAVGTALGVLLSGLILLGSSSVWTVIAMIAVLAAARPLLRETNYTAYATVMTPLVILLLDFGQSPSWAVIIDRLVATLAGCALSLTLGYLAWSRLSPPAPAAAK